METTELELAPVSALQQISKAEIDCQISTAKQYPRSLELFQKRSIDMVSLDHETAESCIYSRPVGGGKYAEGESVRMAEIVAANYGNLRVAARIIEQTERQVKVQGMCHDLETNVASTSEVVESTVKKNGDPFDERMRVVVAKAALAKARRDATFQVVPKALCKQISNAAKNVIQGGATLEQRRERIVEWIKSIKVDESRVFAALKVEGIAEIGEKHLVTLTGIRTAIKEGGITIDEAFPLPEKKPSMADEA